VPKEPKARSRRPARTIIDYATTDALWLRNVIQSIIVDGSAIMLGRTRDEGALMVRIWCGDEQEKEYITRQDDIVPVIESMLDDLGITFLPYGLKDEAK